MADDLIVPGSMAPCLDETVWRRLGRDSLAPVAILNKSTGAPDFNSA
jgi:hypothetical protein